MWSSWLSVALGIWLALSPFVLGTRGAFLNDLLVGAAIAVFAFLGAVGARWANWVNVILGLWLVLMPFAMRLGGPVRTNEMVVGVAVAVLSWMAATVAAGRDEVKVGGEGSRNEDEQGR